MAKVTQPGTGVPADGLALPPITLPLEQFAKIADSLPALIAYIDARQRYRFCNTAFEEWFGRAGESIRGKTVEEVRGRAAYEALRPRIDAVLAGEPVAFDAVAAHRDGRQRHIHAEYVPDFADGEVRGYYALITDTDARTLAEEALRREEQHYRALADVLPAHIVTLSPDGTMESVNRSYMEYTGYTVEEARDYVTRQIIHPDDEPAAMAVWAHALETGEPMQNEMRLRRHDGAYRWHLVEGVPLRASDGAITQWVTVSVDIDDRTRLEQERDRWMHELERANAAKDEFLGLVSHELRTPITTIFGNAQVLRRSAGRISDAERLEALADIETEADRLQRIIENMLILARVDAHSELEIEPLALVRLIELVVEHHRMQHPSRPIGVEVEADLPLAMAQRTYVELILRNLLSNAEKYSMPGTVINLRAARTGSDIQVSVLDECDGISESDIEAMFTPFFRAASTKRTAAGAGIGLAVCRRLVEMQDGRIWAKSDGAAGCEISFTLPVVEASPA